MTAVPEPEVPECPGSGQPPQRLPEGWWHLNRQRNFLCPECKQLFVLWPALGETVIPPHPKTVSA